MKTVIGVVLFFALVAGWAVTSPARFLTREYCLKLSQDSAERIRVSTLRARDVHAQQVLYDECFETNEDNTAWESIQLLFFSDVD